MTKNMFHTEKGQASVSADGKAYPAGGTALTSSAGSAASVRQSQIEEMSSEWAQAGISNAFLFGKIMTTDPDLLLELLQ